MTVSEDMLTSCPLQHLIQNRREGKGKKGRLTDRRSKVYKTLIRQGTAEKRDQAQQTQHGMIVLGIQEAGPDLNEDKSCYISFCC